MEIQPEVLVAMLQFKPNWSKNVNFSSYLWLKFAEIVLLLGHHVGFVLNKEAKLFENKYDD